MKRRARILALSVVATLAASAVSIAQDGLSPELGAALDEERAWTAARTGRYIDAREIAEGVIRQDPDSYLGHLALGFVHRRGEANFPRALYHLRRAKQLVEAEHGDVPDDPAVWRHYARILWELTFTHGDLEDYPAQLRAMAYFNERYDPDFVAERAWPFMKMRRFDDAREAARLGMAAGDMRQEELALNALCAIEFEAGDEPASYEACRAAMDFGGANPERQSAVDFTNFAEAARSVFRLDEAERVDRLGTEAQVAWYGNPWIELGELYVREGRFAEALQALQQAPPYRAQRPPHVRDSDRGDGRRALASFFLTIGRADDAVRIAEEAVRQPDRRAHNSRDPAQDRALAALLHRAALRLRAERTREAAVGGSLLDGITATASVLRDRYDAWLAGRVAARELADDERLVGTFQIGTHRSAVMPPWLAPELADVLGDGVMREAIRRARAEDEREGAGAYYDAFEAETARGDAARAEELATRALAGLDPAEALLRARMMAIRAQAARDRGDVGEAREAYAEAFQTDPGVFRRLGWTVPARFESSGGIAEDLADAIAGGPRFDDDDGLLVRVSGTSTLEACLLDAAGNRLGCSSTARGEDDEDAFVARAAADFHQAAFAPRVELSQADANGLDGSNRLSRDPLETLFGGGLED